MRLGAPLAVHRSTTAHVGAAYPWIPPGSWGSRGVVIGRDAYGSVFAYDCWELSPDVVTAPNMIVIGESGQGKSAFVKSFVYRQVPLGRRAFCVDPKGENSRLCRALGVSPIKLAPGGEVRLNPLDPILSRAAGASPESLVQQQLSMLLGILGAALERRLLPREETAVELALKHTLSRHNPPTLRALVEALLVPASEQAATIRTSKTRLADDGRDVALALRALCDGHLRGMFDGPTSSSVDLTAPLVSLDLSSVRESDALGILMVCAIGWLQGTIAADKRHCIVVLDEAWAICKRLQIARWLQASFKLARSQGSQNIGVFHRLSDLSAAGQQGSEQVELARGLLSDSATQVIYQQPPDQVELTRELLRLTPAEVEAVGSLQRGRALWRVGARRFVVEHILSSRERWIVESERQALS
jgi:type IV secretory pathway VirB4 component